MSDSDNRDQVVKGASSQAHEEYFPAEDIEKGKTMAGLSYLIFFLPLVACPESKYGRFHANQALLLLLVSIAGNIVLGIIPVVGWMLLPFFAIVILVFVVMGIVNGLGGKAKQLPIIGKFTLIK